MNPPTEDSILKSIQHAIVSNVDWAKISILPTQNIHIAVMSQPYLSLILSGEKTIESRFSLNRITPYAHVKVGDIVFMKHDPIVGCFTVSWVKEFDLTQYPIGAIAKEYSEAICANDTFWQENQFKKYATLLVIKDVRKLQPVSIIKHDRRAWVTIDRS